MPSATAAAVRSPPAPGRAARRGGPRCPGAGEVAHRVEQRREGVADSDRDEHEQGGDRAARPAGPTMNAATGRHRGRHEQRRSDQGAPRLCRRTARRSGRGRREPPAAVVGADGLQLGGLAGDEVADPQHLGARLEQLVALARLEHPGQPAGAATTTIRPASTTRPPGRTRGEHDRDEPGEGARDQRHGDPYLGLDDVGQVVDDTGEHARRDRRPSRAGVSGTSAAYTEVRRAARSSRAASCDTSRSR